MRKNTFELAGTDLNSHCSRARRPIRSALISGFLSMKRLGVFLLPPGWDASPSQGYPQHYAGTHLYTWMERGTVRVKCLAQEHNTMSPARTRTWTTGSGVEHTNHEATVPPRGRNNVCPSSSQTDYASYIGYPVFTLDGQYERQFVWTDYASQV